MPGIRQRIQEAEQTQTKRLRGGEDAEEAISPLAIELLRLWSMGQLSAVAAQRLANAALLEGLESIALAEIAALGSWGENSSHVHRELVALASRGMNICEPLILQVPALNNKKNPPIVDTDFAILPPHLLLHSLAQHHEAAFEEIWNTSALLSFWNSVKADDPRLINNPILDIPAYKRTFIPLWVHGDGVEFSTDSMLVFSTGSLLSRSSTMDSSCLIAAWPKSATAKTAEHNTWKLPFEVMTWSFQALFQGKHPDKDWNGRRWDPTSPFLPLAGKNLFPKGYKCIVWSLLGDLEYFANTLKYPHWKRIEFCWLCNCSRHDATRHWCDVRLEPGWVERSHEWQEANPCTSHPFVLSLPGVMPAYLPALDVLHVLDQGLMLHVLGSVLHIWAYDNTLPPAAALNNIWEQIRIAYRDLHCEHRLTNLTLSMFCDPAKPHTQPVKLRCKAAEARHLLPAASVVAMKILDSSNEVSAHVASMLQLFSQFYLLLIAEGIVLSSDAAERCLEAMDKGLLHYAWLRTHFKGTHRFHMVPKAHFAKHLARGAKWLNPRFSWTYKNEDYVGQLAEIALSCSHGTAAHRLSVSLMQKYRIMYHLRLIHGWVKD